MNEKDKFDQIIEEIYAQDNRYKPDGYEFVLHALHFTQDKLKRKAHITGKELLLGIRDFAIDQYGPMAKTLLAHWGINKTEDFGNIVFNMVEKRILSKTEEDSVNDFNNVYEFSDAFGNIWRDSKIGRIDKNIYYDLKKNKGTPKN